MVERYANGLADGEKLPEIIAMHGVSITYQGVPVLKGIDWTVHQGERWALLGPNGAGKTTLLSLILADNPQAYTNDMRLFGQPRGSGESIWQIKRRIGWVSPELQVFYDRSLTVREVVSSGFFDSVGLYRRCNPEQAAIVSDWMEALDLTYLAERPIHTLSTGQQRLALLARALVKTPPLLVLDEPCQGLDSEHRFQIIDLVDRLCRVAPVTLIYVSHYADEIPAAITHQILLNNGEIQRCQPVG
jgi:molybdate transport system ATP-binding protein